MDRRDTLCCRRPLETVINAFLEDRKVLICLRSSADKGVLNAADFFAEERNMIFLEARELAKS